LTTRRAASIASQQTPTLSDPWALFAHTLEACIGAMEEGEILILSRRTANQFVQLFHKGDMIIAEAASNSYIEPPPFLLNTRQYARALDMGWRPPTMTGEDFDGLQKLQAMGVVEHSTEPDGTKYESPNFHVLFPLDASSLAWFLIETLRRVYKVRKPSDLQYRSFEADDGTQIKWPTLGLARSPVPS